MHTDTTRTPILNYISTGGVPPPGPPGPPPGNGTVTSVGLSTDIPWLIAEGDNPVTTSGVLALDANFSGLGGALYLDDAGNFSAPPGSSPPNTFSTFAVSGQSNVIADTTNDTLTLVAGTGITITTNAGTDTVTVNASATAQVHAVTLVCDGSGSVVSAGTKNPIKIPYGGTLTGWLLIGSPSGSVTVDILRAADGAGLPVTSIVGAGTKPALSSAVENSSTSFTSWTSTILTAKDNLAISLSGVATCTYVALTLYFS